MIQSRLFLLGDDNFIYGALSDLTLCGVFSLMFNVKVPQLWIFENITSNIVRCTQSSTALTMKWKWDQ